ncbi:2-hydroxy-3-oxopropionate reductase [Calorimonas adulescens]|jgi:tartronate semialdehyde reductase (EC 1.1.1.60)|uniref:2-hydroxy-3-oxopropionate reductase n=1 Tax=Calorimonas adulescens TaxID=2606906 RepID=A0A5D8QA48_9THEO|nr:2-hydroxy-3-oxopropionate reductase [Calorimonas adulescens]TZE81470.1 2-hydroxy-3-oxopropionate reductase [Calorimonas adulescens]
MKVGFIGLGIMGRPMAKNLIKAGYSLVVMGHRNRTPVEELVSLGAEEAKTPGDVGKLSDLVITMLPDSPEVREVVLGEDGLINGMRPGSILIDMSSISPAASKEISNELAKKGIRMMDAPVSGGEQGAIDGTLAIMVGGSESDFEECLPVLRAVGKSIVRVGDIGSGNTAKLVNQIIVAGNIAVMSEAFAMGVKAGADPERIYEAIKGGLAGSRVLDAKLPAILKRNFTPGFKLKLHIKDLKNALDEAHDIAAFLPITSMVMEMMQNLKADGKDEMDHAALVQFYEKIVGSEVKNN